MSISLFFSASSFRSGRWQLLRLWRDSFYQFLHYLSLSLSLQEVVTAKPVFFFISSERERKAKLIFLLYTFFLSEWVLLSFRSLFIIPQAGFFSLYQFPWPFVVITDEREREEKRKEMCFASVAPAAVAAVWTWCPWWQTTTLSYTATFAFSVHVRDYMYIAY